MNLSANDIWAIFLIGLFTWLSIIPICGAISAKYPLQKDTKNLHDDEEEV